MGKKKADEMLFWTKDEFQTFIESMKDRPASYNGIHDQVLHGIREGELLAITPSDIDFEKKTLTVNKSYQRLGREDIITTLRKRRKASALSPFPDGLCNCLQEYMSHCYGLQKDDRLFPYTKSFLYHEMSTAASFRREADTGARHSTQPRQPAGGDGLLPAADCRAARTREGADHDDTYSHPVPQQTGGGSQTA